MTRISFLIRKEIFNFKLSSVGYCNAQNNATTRAIQTVPANQTAHSNQTEAKTQSDNGDDENGIEVKKIVHMGDDKVMVIKGRKHNAQEPDSDLKVKWLPDGKMEVRKDDKTVDLVRAEHPNGKDITA